MDESDPISHAREAFSSMYAIDRITNNENFW